MHVDALSDVLKTIRMTGAVFFCVSARAPWVAQQLPREAVLPMILPGAEHMISYHIVTEGQCFANVIGGESIALTAGQVIVFTRGDRHVMSSEPGMRVVPLTRFANDGVPENVPFTATFGSTGPITAKVVCGFLACDLSPFNPLLESLPSILVADGSRRLAVAQRAGATRHRRGVGEAPWWSVRSRPVDGAHVHRSCSAAY